MRLEALAPAAEHVSVRYRLTPWADGLRDVGIDLTIEPLADVHPDRWRQLARPRGAALLVRKLLPVPQLWRLRRSSEFLAFDFDDAIFQHDTTRPRSAFSLTRRLRFLTLIRAADLVIAGNADLANQVDRWSRGKTRVVVLPTCVDPNRYLIADHASDPARLVWIGSPSTAAGLPRAGELWRRLATIPQASLRLIGSGPIADLGIPTDVCAWSTPAEASMLSAGGVGVSWLPDDAWSRGKCGLKILQYMAAGLPVLASPVGVHPRLLDQDEFSLPRSIDDWRDRVALLLHDPERRRQIGQRWRQRVRDHFSVQHWGPIVARTWSEALTS